MITHIKFSKEVHAREERITKLLEDAPQAKELLDKLKFVPANKKPDVLEFLVCLYRTQYFNDDGSQNREWMKFNGKLFVKFGESEDVEAHKIALRLGERATFAWCQVGSLALNIAEEAAFKEVFDNKSLDFIEKERRLLDLEEIGHDAGAVATQILLQGPKSDTLSFLRSGTHNVSERFNRI